jgi:hypothetical protein
LMRCGAWVALAQRTKPQSTPTLNFKCLLNGVIGVSTVDFEFVFRI